MILTYSPIHLILRTKLFTSWQNLPSNSNIFLAKISPTGQLFKSFPSQSKIFHVMYTSPNLPGQNISNFP